MIFSIRDAEVMEALKNLRELNEKWKEYASEKILANSDLELMRQKFLNKKQNLLKAQVQIDLTNLKLQLKILGVLSITHHGFQLISKKINYIWLAK